MKTLVQHCTKVIHMFYIYWTVSRHTALLYLGQFQRQSLWLSWTALPGSLWYTRVAGTPDLVSNPWFSGARASSDCLWTSSSETLNTHNKYEILTLWALNYFCKNHGDQKFFFQFEIIINVLVSSFWFIWISMLWVYGHINIFTLAVWGSILVVRIWRLQPKSPVRNSRGPKSPDTPVPHQTYRWAPRLLQCIQRPDNT